MPTYEYQCPKCHLTYSEMRIVEERDATPDCKWCGIETNRLLSSPGIKFKGSGFYSTDK